MNPTKIKTFRNVRARLYRPASGVWLAGWMKHLTPEVVRIRLKSFVMLQPGERLQGECYGDGSLVRFEGLFVGQSGQEIGLKVGSALSYEPSPETIRLEVESFEAHLLDDTRRIRVLVMDASPRSLGGIADGSMVPGTEATMIAATPDGEIEAQVRIVNCRADVTQPGHFRIGIAITEMRRLDAARWARLIDEWAEA